MIICIQRFVSSVLNSSDQMRAPLAACGDDGADDYDGKELPESYSDVFDDGFSNNPS